MPRQGDWSPAVPHMWNMWIRNWDCLKVGSMGWQPAPAAPAAYSAAKTAQFILLSGGKRCLEAHPDSALCTGDTYLWNTVVWNTYMYYFACPYRTSQSLSFWLISIFSLSPPRELKSEHLLSLPISSFLQLATGTSCLVLHFSRSFHFNSFRSFNLLLQ